MCNFLVVPGYRQTLLGMPDMEILNILSVGCNTIGTKEAGRDAKCSTNTPSTHNKGSG